MLDDAVVAFSASLAPGLKLKGTRLRYFFKQALRGFLPDEIITKKKHGFGLPFGLWLQTHRPLQQIALDSLADLKQRQFVRPEFIDELTSMHVQEPCRLLRDDGLGADDARAVVQAASAGVGFWVFGFWRFGGGGGARPQLRGANPGGVGRSEARAYAWGGPGPPRGNSHTMGGTAQPAKLHTPPSRSACSSCRPRSPSSTS